MSILDVAMRWRDFGNSPIPIMHRSKRPLIKWTEYQTNIPQETEIKNWFSTDKVNLGLVCGGRNNLTVLDFDNLRSYYKVVSDMSRSIQSLFNCTFKVLTNRGIHVYLTTGEIERTKRISSMSLDIKGCGGYVLTPPSMHPSGTAYTELSGNILGVETLTEIFGSQLAGQVAPASAQPETVIEQITKEELRKGSSFFEKLYILKKNMNVLDVANMFTYMESVSPDGRWWYGRCPHPNHDDKHPSFRVDAAYGLCRCLSDCQLNNIRGMDLLDLYCAITGLKNTVALDQLIEPFIVRT